MSAVSHFKGKVGALSRSRTSNDPDLLDARQNLKAARLEEYVARTVSEAPTLTPEQADRIAGLLRGGAA